jgi:hypothetical protein
MQFLHHGFAFELSNEWWAEAGMNGFIPTCHSYRADTQAFPGQIVYEVRIDEVSPVERKLSHGVFNNDIEKGLTAKDRVLKILRGFVANDAIPPVKVVPLPTAEPYCYKLTDGAHRFYLAIAAGFTHVPAVDGFDWSGLKPGF